MIFEVLFFVLSTLFIFSFFYVTCTPPGSEDLVHIITYLAKGPFKIVKYLLTKYYYFAGQYASVVIFMVFIFYVVYFLVYKLVIAEEVKTFDDIIEFIVKAAALAGFYALLDDRRKQRKTKQA